MLLIFLSTVVIVPLILAASFRISKIINLYDYPDKVRKLHIKPILLIGGIFFQFVLTFYFCLLFYFSSIEKFEPIVNFNSNYFVLLGIISISFLIGIIDDKKNIKPFIKLILIFFLYFLSLNFVDTIFVIKKLSFYFNLNIHLYSYSIFFTSICLIIILNAINMADGVNSLSSSIFFIWIFFLNLTLPSGDFFFIINILLMLCLIIFGILNYQSKCFLGDSGCYVLVTYTSFLTIYAYNINLDSFYSYLNIESIFLLFMIPGLDMIRLFITRIFKKKNPFSPDNNHLHHLLLYKYGNLKTLIIYDLLIFIPWLVYIFFISLLPYLILSVLIIYIYLISLKYKNEKN